MNRMDHNTPLAYGPVESDADIAALMSILGRAFGMKPRDRERYHQRVGPKNFRAVRDGDTVVGGLAIIRMGQFFGGRNVPMAGIAAVGVASWMRGRGAARTLMANTLKELRDDSFPISTLYPATQTLYRSVGYELAGSQYEITLPLSEINVRGNGLVVRPARPDDEPMIEKVYKAHAASHPGNLDRNEVMWQRLRSPRGKTADGFVVERDGTIEGYIYFVQESARNKPYSLRISDIQATTPECARRLLAFLAEHRSIGQGAIWMGSPCSVMLAAMPENAWKISLHCHWMTRILDVKAALEQRGYAPCTTGTLEIEVEDDIIDANNGAWTLTVTNGKASVERGGGGAIRLSARALAPLYAGFISARDLATLGWIDAKDSDAVALADSIFAGPTPWMSDGF